MKKFGVILLVLLISLMAFSIVYAGDGGTKRTAILLGSNEIPSGDPDGSGFSTVRLNYGLGTVCWNFSVEDVEPITAAHIHRAPAGQNGPVVVNFMGASSGCTDVERSLIKEIIQNPGEFYVNVHNATFPGGALRGQLNVPGQNK